MRSILQTLVFYVAFLEVVAALSSGQAPLGRSSWARQRRHPKTALASSPADLELILTTDLSNLASTVNSFYTTSPVEAAALTCGIKASCSDAVSQNTAEPAPGASAEDDNTAFCWSRNSAFLLYGSLYQGVVQHFMYNELFPMLFGEGTDWTTVTEKVLLDQFVLFPFLGIPVSYLVKAAVFKQPWRGALEHYAADARKDLLLKAWAIWIPVQFCTFSVVPVHLRIPFIALVSFFWLIILSNISNRPQPLAPAEDGAWNEEPGR